MTESELKMLKEEIETNNSTVSVSELPPDYVGTLVFGYDTDGDVVHVYVENGLLHSLTYTHDGVLLYKVSGETIDTVDCVPNKRDYRQNTQYFMAVLLKSKDHPLDIIEGFENEKDLAFGTFLKRAKKLADLIDENKV